MMDCKAFALLLDTPWEKLTQAFFLPVWRQQEQLLLQIFRQ